MRDGIIATARARATTIGVYTRAKRVMNLSILGFDAAAFSTASRILVTMDSSRTLSTHIVIRPVSLMQPDINCVPGSARTGTGSPVTGAVLTRVSPSRIVPSRGIKSPGRTSIVQPTSTFSGDITTISPPPHVSMTRTS